MFRDLRQKIGHGLANTVAVGRKSRITNSNSQPPAQQLVCISPDMKRWLFSKTTSHVFPAVSKQVKPTTISSL